MAKIGLWSDNHNFPSIPLMKISAYHKLLSDDVELFNHLNFYDKVYSSKVFSFSDDIEDIGAVNADELVKGGTGYCISAKNGKEAFDESKNINLPKSIENICPDYSLFPKYDFAAGFLTRGCPRGCSFCIVGEKEGLVSHQVADISDFYLGQKKIELCDPNFLACKEHEKLLLQLSELKVGRAKVKINFNQGLDIRLTNKDNIKLLNQLSTPLLHFAWDYPKIDLTRYFKLFQEHTKMKSDRTKIVYVLTNFNTSHDEDLYRIYTLRDLGYSPYVTVYQKETAPKITKQLQRWCNSKIIFYSCKDFKDYNSSIRKGGEKNEV